MPLKIAVDSVLGSQPIPPSLAAVLPEAMRQASLPLLLAAVALHIAIATLSHLRGLALWQLSSFTGEQLILSFRAKLFAHAQRLPLQYHERAGVSASLYRIYHDAAAIKAIPIDGLIPLLSASLMFIGMIYVTMMIDWQLGLTALAVAPPLVVLTRRYGGRLRRKWAEVKAIEASNIGMVQEVLGAFRLIKTFGREEYESRRFLNRAATCTQGHIQIAVLGSRFDFFSSLTMSIGTAIVLFIGVQHVQGGKLTLGELLMVMAYLAQIYGPLETATKKVAELQAALASTERALALLDEPCETLEHPHARALTRARGAVAFQNVSFGYEAGRPVLRHSTFEVAPGTRVGIIGATGAGKTTLIHLLTRMYDPTEGRILLDGIDLREYRLADLRRQFAIVLQEPLLFSTTIADNIAYGRPDASLKDIMAAARAAHAHEFIMALPEGYQTQVGERGVRLSGGERQRVSLARAFLRDAPILILDEPTSSLDMGTEAEIVQAMESLMQGRTTFLIAHRHSTLQHCDLRIVIEKGRLSIVEPRDTETKHAVNLHR